MAAPIFFFDRDARILDMIRKGKEEALVILFKETNGLVRDFMRKNNGSTDDADDALQDALIILWERVRGGRFEHSAKLSTFLFSVVRNRWLRVLAARKREPALDPGTDPASEDDSPEDVIVGPSASWMRCVAGCCCSITGMNGRWRRSPESWDLPMLQLQNRRNINARRAWKRFFADSPGSET
jgi:RNA polymerase sigma factor (sigma-70 family)